MRGTLRVAAMSLVASFASGCGAWLDRACQAAHERGAVALFEGVVEPGQVVSWLVPYDQQGTQNDTRIVWPGRTDPDGPRLRLFATSADCAAFTPPTAPDRMLPRGAQVTDPAFKPGDPCRVLSGRSFGPGVGDELVQSGFSIAGGPKQGLPDLRAYKLHLVGDARVRSAYTVRVEWWRGPSC